MLNISFIFGFRALKCIGRYQETMAWGFKNPSKSPQAPEGEIRGHKVLVSVHLQKIA